MGKSKKKRSQQRRQRQQQQQETEQQQREHLPQLLQQKQQQQQQVEQNKQKILELTQQIQQHQQTVAQLEQEEKFDSLYNEGVSLWFKDDKGQEAAEKFLEAVYSAPSVWIMDRFFAFVCVMDVALESEDSDSFSVTFDFLDNEEEPAHFRAYAALSAAQRCCFGSNKNLNMNSTAEHCRHGLEIINKSPEEDGDRKVLQGAPAMYYMACFQDPVSDDDDDDDDDYDHSLTLKMTLEGLREQLGLVLEMSESGGMTEIPADREHALLMERYCAGGKRCDCCGKTLEELELSFLQRCRRCDMVFYCSKKCQSKDWRKGGHSHTCRKPGQIKVGDDMMLEVLDDDEDKWFHVEVIARVEGETNRWQVKFYESGEIHDSVDGDQLIRLRPPPKPKS